MTPTRALAERLITRADDASLSLICSTLERFGAGALRFALDAGTRIVPLTRGERYNAASPAIARLGIDVDAWPAPPAGLFVVEERTVYVRSRSPMTVAHVLYAVSL
ncbi:MAG: hypothetical protein KGN02_14055 [bacterium]|nr:hypothetical protein [bacterium]